MGPTAAPLTGLTSKATAAVLTELVPMARAAGLADVAFDAVGGVDATRRVMAGDDVDVIVLDAAAIEQLGAAGRVVADSARPLIQSQAAIAVPAGAERPDVSTEDAFRQALVAAGRIGYSTGPSGVALVALIDRLGLADALADRLVQAPPGVPVGSLLAEGKADLGIQQISELVNVAGITILGGMPPGCTITSRFVGAVGVACDQVERAQALLDYLASPATEQVKRRHGMSGATA